MKKLLFSIIILLLMPASNIAQTVTLIFTGRNDADDSYVQLDRVEIVNISKVWQETIYWPDTILTMQYGDGINDGGSITIVPKLQLSQNTPNPFNGSTDVMLTVADEGAVTVEITDLNGHIVTALSPTALPCGIHQFHVNLAVGGTYVMSARQNGKKTSIKMMNHGGGSENGIEYVGIVQTLYDASTTPKSDIRLVTDNLFEYGDLMEFIGSATFDGIEYESQVIMQHQGQDTVIKLVFLTIEDPCEGTPTLTDIDGNVYHTVALGNQCWMKENLRVTRFADSTEIPLFSSEYSSTTPYRFVPLNNESNVITDGYLYNWPATTRNVVSTANPSGVQGVCPTGWHVPSEAEWSQLTGYVWRQEQYLCNGNSESAFIAKALADTTGWRECTEECAVGNDQSSNNATLFSAVPAGNYGGSQFTYGQDAAFWTTTSTNEYHAKIFYLNYYWAWVTAESLNRIYGFSVRCVKD